MANNMLNNIWPEWKVEGKPLGRGSYGVVYKAVRRDHDVESFAAIKVISIPQNESEIDSLRSEGMSIDATRTYLEGIVSDFVSEIQLMESFKGVQNIVSVEDYKVVEKTDEVGWDIYIRMELLTPFNSYISDKTMSEEEVIKLGVDICTALELCAERNVIHRDIKPQNIFINQFGHFKLGDFGIARKLENVTGGLSQKGSPNYMAPEVAHSTQYDATVDLYSLGIVLYQLMNKNRLPFLDTERQLLNPNERAAALSRRLEGEPLLAPCDASPAMAEVILCASNPDPSKRFASATAMKRALMSVANGTYSASEADLNKTMSVRHASQAQDPNRTTSVRKAPQPQKSAQKSVDTFGGKKKSKAPAIIAAVLAVVLLVGGGVFVVPRLLGNNDSQESSVDVVSDDNGSSDSVADGKNGVYSDFDEEQIAAAIEEAEALAADEDYEGALTKVKTALVTYPKSEELKAKETEYTDALAAQAKAKTLEEAANLAESGDYVSAIALIRNAQESNDEDLDYTNAYNTYCASYKAETIRAADEMANNGNYVGAIQAIGEASAIIGEDSELSKRSNEYENEYITAIINESNTLASANSFTEAMALIDSALKELPGNQRLIDQKSTIQTAMPKNFMEVCAPYDYQNAEPITTTVLMSGERYTNGFVQNYSSDGQILSNLGNRYTEMSFTVGHVDGTKMCDYQVEIYLDGEYYDSFEVKATGMPLNISVPVSGVNQLMIKWATGHRSYQDGCRIAFANIIVHPNIETGTEVDSINDTASWENFMEVCTPYDYQNAELITAVTMSGERYTNGFVQNYSSDGQILSNLGNRYTEMSFTVGHVDGTKMCDYQVEIYLDGEYYDSFEVKATGMPFNITVPVSGADQLMIKWATGHRNYQDGCRIAFANIKIH